MAVATVAPAGNVSATTSCAAGSAHATTILISAGFCIPVAHIGAADERFDERIRDMREYRSDCSLEDTRGEFVGQLEVDLAGVGTERNELPFAMQIAKRTVFQRDGDRFGRMGH